MNLIRRLFLPLSLFSITAIAQKQSGTITGDVSKEIKSFEAPPIKMDLSFGYSSNIDLLDKTQNIIKYSDNGLINMGAATEMTSELFDNPLTYSTSLKAVILQDDDYYKSSDAIRNLNFNNSFFLKFKTNEKFSFGPTLDLNAEKRFTFAGFHRKRDNLNGALGIKASYIASSELILSSNVSMGYVDHSGNYVDLNSAKRAFEHNLEEDRSVFKAGLTGVWKANKILSVSMPLTYERNNYTEKRARSADPSDRDLATWSRVNNRPYVDQALDLQTTSAGLVADIALNSFISTSLGYTFVDDKEMNIGQKRNNADTDVYSASINGSMENLSLALSYSNENIHYNNILGGMGKEITQVYASKFSIANVFPDTSAILDFKYTDYQESYPNANASDKAIDRAAMIGIATTL